MKTRDAHATDNTTEHTTSSDSERVAAWLKGRLPEDWTGAAPEVVLDREEITVVLTLPDTATDPEGAADAEGTATDPEEIAGRVSRFREDTRGTRMRIADEAERRYGRKTAWGVRAGDTRMVFTTLSVPVMTRLRQPERLVLDTLVDTGVARSRAQALAWCVRLVGERSESWLADLRTAMGEVDKVRAAGPGA